MTNNLYPIAEKFVVDSFTKAGKTQGLKHFLRTVYWLKGLDPNADEAMCIAAVAHDIERAFRGKDVAEKNKSLRFTDPEFLRPHEERGADIIGDFLQQHGASNNLVDKIKMLVSRHEEGGNDEQNLLKDADSISFFENQIEHFITKMIQEHGKDKVREKLEWMFHRISSEKAKDIARPWYEEAMKKLEQ